MIFFTISDPPENTNLTTTANTSATLKNSNVTFTCTAEGSPPPHEYRFYHKGTFLGSSSSGTFQTQVTKSGLSVFSCVPLNKYLNESRVGENRSVTINVVGELFWMLVKHYLRFCLSTVSINVCLQTCTYSNLHVSHSSHFIFGFSRIQ